MNRLILALTCALTATLMLFTSINLSAQDKVVLTGKVVTEDGQSVIGAGVVEKGTSNGTSTDIDGKFTITVSKDAILTVSCIGYVDNEVIVGDRNNLEIVISEDKRLLEEAVVIGYGTVKKKDLTGAVANVSGDKLANLQTTSLSQALQGSMPGVQVTRTSGLPGAGATIRVRGITTIGDSNPLIIVDGIPVTSINDVDVDDIESINVLKDAASASIYGARASSGVVLVTTKRAKPGILNIDYNGTFSVITRTTKPVMSGVQDYMRMMNEVEWNDSGNTPGEEYRIYPQDVIDNYYSLNAQDPDLYPITDWDALCVNKTAPRQKHRVSLTYGNNVIKSRAMLSYTKEDALYDGRSEEEFNGRINNDITINRFLAASVDMQFLHTTYRNTSYNPIQAAYKYGQNRAALWSNGTIAEGHIGSNAWARLLYGGFDNSWRDVFNAKVSLTLTPFKNFSIQAVFAPSIRDKKSKTFINQVQYYNMDDAVTPAGYVSGCETNNLTEGRTDSMDLTKQLVANYSLDLAGSHHFTFMAGYEDHYAFSESLSAASDHMDLADYPYLSRGNLEYKSNTGNASENAYMSFFGRLTYDFKGRYLFQANARYDGSSRFHKDYRWGFFPSASFGWVLSQEPFFKNLDLSAVNFLKFRASYGTLGNEKIGNYPYQAIMDLGHVAMHNGTALESAMTAAQTSYNILDITWETTRTWNVGADATLLQNRLTLSGDYFRKETDNMLLALEIPDLIGYGNPDQNAGKMHTRGWEVQAGWNDRIGNFIYALSAHLSDYKSIMGDLSGIVFDGANIIKEGSEYNEWYGYKSAGLFQSMDDIASSALLNSNVKPGDVKYVDISGPDGVPDGKISPEYDRVLLGGSLPRYQYGGNINLGYKHFDFTLTFQGIGKRTDRLTDDMVYQTVQWHNLPTFYAENRWSEHNTPEQNESAKYPRLSQLQYKGNNFAMSDFWLFDGSYFRVKNIGLSYTVPNALLKKIDVSKMRIYASVTDPFSIDHFPEGFDPEASVSAYIARTFNFGLQITF